MCIRDSPWRVAIVEPSDRPGAIEDVVTPNGMAVSTAGSYRNYYELDGKRYSHIIDPATGEPVTHKLVSATVITPTALELSLIHIYGDGGCRQIFAGYGRWRAPR